MFWVLHSICCMWYLAGTQEPLPRGIGLQNPSHDHIGWVEKQFQGTERHCACYNTPGVEALIHYDTFDRVCLNISDMSQTVRKPCEDSTFALPTPAEYYWKSLFKAITRPYSDSSPAQEIVVAISATILMGYLWGAIAGAVRLHTRTTGHSTDCHM